MARRKKSSKRRMAPKITTMHGLFEHELEDIYYAEQKLVKALSKLEKESDNFDSKEAFRMHREETENHVKRLEQVFQSFGMKPRSKKCDGIMGLIKENDVVLRLRPIQKIKDLVILGSASKIERYEISAYENLIWLAQKHDMNDVVPLLEENLREEQAALEKVKDIMANFDASNIETGMESEMEMATTS